MNPKNIIISNNLKGGETLTILEGVLHSKSRELGKTDAKKIKKEEENK